MRNTHAAICAIFACGVLRAATTRADPPPPPSNPVVEWDAPPGCPSAADVHAAIQALLGGSSRPATRDGVSMRGTVSQSAPSSFSLRVRVDVATTSEVRTIEAESCAALADAYAVIAAYAINPGAATLVESRATTPPASSTSTASGATTPAAASAPPAAVASAPPASAPPAPVASAPPASAPPAAVASAPPASAPPAPVAPTSRIAIFPARRGGVASAGDTGAPPPVPLRLAAGAFVAFGAGQLPFPAYGLGGALGLEHGMRWELAGAYWPPQLRSRVVGAAGTVGARIQLAAGRASGCLLLARGAVAVCGGAEIGAMQARGTGVPSTRLGSSWWAAPVAALELRLRAGQTFALALRLEGGVSILRPHFVLQDVGGDASVETYRPAPVFWAVALQPEVQLFSTDRSPAAHVHP